MFTARKGGLPELFLALLCGWAALHHTPAGGLLQSLWARALGRKDTSPSLLAYYGSPSTPRAQQSFGLHVPLPVLSPPDADAYEALGLALHGALKNGPLPETTRALATAHAIEPEMLQQAVRGPAACERLLRELADDLGGHDAAVLAVFAGAAPARYAHGRALADGDRADLDALGRALPPGYGRAVERAREVLAVGLAYGLRWPVDEGTRVSSGFGWRTHPTLGTRKLHTGVDLAVPVGTEVRATASGIVRRASHDGVNGNVLVLDHGRGVTTAYCHNDRLLVGVGEAVEEGQAIARSGNTGRSTGPHLHYQLELRGEPVDPLALHRRMGPAFAITGGQIE